MKQLIIESTDKNDTITDIEEKLEKALSSIKIRFTSPKIFRCIFKISEG